MSIVKARIQTDAEDIGNQDIAGILKSKDITITRRGMTDQPREIALQRTTRTGSCRI